MDIAIYVVAGLGLIALVVWALAFRKPKAPPAQYEPGYVPEQHETWEQPKE